MSRAAARSDFIRARVDELSALLDAFEAGRPDALSGLRVCARRAREQVPGSEITIRAIAMQSGRLEDTPCLTRALIRALRRVQAGRSPNSTGHVRDARPVERFPR